ncbi:Superoxide dismutase [Cu-Zn] precursor [Novipirellula galeiformis]|uniref:Superoxide dismutase [Cu-Zn] n=1 Tax=Novipirellula galeiformis TaxID=2528004 RepID=A0A5C6C977_9BACT|nr:superoxide dismutase family protein [Novipirellula galeiformis]TWU21140.1 Superoxide dismutase [Cu-Zn] precursor [Novipirellula galeiformis]
MQLGLMKTATAMAFVAIAAFFTAPVASADDHKHDKKHDHAHGELPTLGICVLMPTKGNKTRGTLRLVQKGDALTITGQVRNLTPGEHGFHIHEFGDRRAADGTSAGGHYNPDGHEHGGPGAHSHAGDLGNILANADGVANVNITTKDTALHFILGRSFVVHAGADDLKSQPSGDAGPRVAVGIVGIGNQGFKPNAKK